MGPSSQARIEPQEFQSCGVFDNEDNCTLTLCPVFEFVLLLDQRHFFVLNEYKKVSIDYLAHV